ncbi:TIM barrel protein [Alicyclobacillus sp.]|uniref:TIM barrel protein n=1 Tax=Alicyclobacillus sp. TaxID=61169 RepID=UPI0025C6B583|nr:TIM barrel protein [Alicyclobacillus sp.]MCL6515454.1 TIM barrel protein [Alicyclobacillus sp.]
MRAVPNLSLMFQEVPFLERFAAARRAGFRAVEFQFPYDHPPEDVRHAVHEAGVEVVLFNLPPGDWAAGDRGMACDPDRQQAFEESVEQALRYAEALGCSKLHCLAGRVPEGSAPEAVWPVLVERVRYAADILGRFGRTVMVEACNEMDMPRFALPNIGRAVALLEAVGRDNVRLQFDFYHVQRSQGELLATFRAVERFVGHVQIADNPGRHEPGTGEIHYANVLAALGRMGYDGMVGLEYIPSGRTVDSLAWMDEEEIRSWLTR